jgi:hypothetical protein
VGVLQRFERRLGGLVEGAFARVFGGVVQPVEVAAALQREAQDKRAIVGHGRVLVPNEYVVELGPTDSARLREYDAPLRAELAAMVKEHAAEQGWTFVGPVEVHLEEVEDISTGVFRVRSRVAAHEPVAARPQPGEVPPARAPAAGAGRAPRLELAAGEGRPARTLPLTAQVSVLGRGQEADVQVADTAVSRRHAELRLEPGGVRVVDLRSTNGTRVNGVPVGDAVLRDGDRLEVGSTTLVYRQDG